jgi:ATP-dependent helicase/DNAse subunit B
LGEPDEPASRYELPADKRGTAYHEILHDFYDTLYHQNLTHTLFDAGVAQYMEKSIAKFYTPTSYLAFGIYPVVWEMILEDIHHKLTDFAIQDVSQLGAFTPAIFEQEAVGALKKDLPIKLRGIIDRVDIDTTTHTFYVVDYKSTRKGAGKLAQEFFTELILQPFVYLLLTPSLPQLQEYSPAGACLLAIRSYKKSELTAEEFEKMYPQACAFLTRLTDLIKQGTFFINPSDLCAYCPYSMLCRKDAFKPLLRARKSAQQRALEEARS